MKKLNLFLVSVFILSNCGLLKPKVDIEFESVKPAKFSLKKYDINKVYFLPFDISENKNLLFHKWYYSLDKNIISQKLNLMNNQPNLSLNEIPLFDINLINQLISEYSLDALVKGNISYQINEEVKRRNDSTKIGEKSFSYLSAKIERSIRMNINFDLVDLRKKKIAISSSQPCYLSESTSYYPELTSDITNEIIKTTKIDFLSLNLIHNKLPNIKILIDRCINSSSNLIQKQLFPYKSKEERSVRGSSNPKMADALNFMKKNNWAEAVKIWYEVISINENKEDVEDANFNLGIYYESLDNLDEARKHFLNSYNISNNGYIKDGYLNAIEILEQRKKELQNLKEQGY